MKQNLFLDRILSWLEMTAPAPDHAKVAMGHRHQTFLRAHVSFPRTDSDDVGQNLIVVGGHIEGRASRDKMD